MSTLEVAPNPPYAYTTAETLVAVDHVSLTLDGHVILRDVVAEVQDIERADCVTGQVICFLGPSGIGKTRLSRIMAGLDQPTSGRVQVNVDGQMRPVAKGVVGMVPQNYPLFEFQTVEANLVTAGKQAGLSAIGARAKAAPLIEQFGLGEHLAKYPVQLSGGTRQRVAIVRQLMCSAHFLIMDEPFSGLDPIMKQRACALITQVANRDTLNTIILVTHDVTEGMAVADHVWLMGLEQDAAGAYLPGARIIETIDFAAQGICWQPDIYHNGQFLDQVARVKARFQTLVPR